MTRRSRTAEPARSTCSRSAALANTTTHSITARYRANTRPPHGRAPALPTRTLRRGIGVTTTAFASGSRTPRALIMSDGARMTCSTVQVTSTRRPTSCFPTKPALGPCLTLFATRSRPSSPTLRHCRRRASTRVFRPNTRRDTTFRTPRARTSSSSTRSLTLLSHSRSRSRLLRFPS
jgi:hypothetical protein